MEYAAILEFCNTGQVFCGYGCHPFQALLTGKAMGGKKRWQGGRICFRKNLILRKRVDYGLVTFNFHKLQNCR